VRHLVTLLAGSERRGAGAVVPAALDLAQLLAQATLLLEPLLVPLDVRLLLDLEVRLLASIALQNGHLGPISSDAEEEGVVKPWRAG
jgi:hypothetical protein